MMYAKSFMALDGKGRLTGARTAQTAPVAFIVAGEVRAVCEAFDARELRYATGEQHASGCLLSLLPVSDA